MCIFSLQFYCTVHTLSLINVGFLPLLSSTGYPSNYPSALGLNLTHWLAVNSLLCSWPQPHTLASSQFTPPLLASTSPQARSQLTPPLLASTSPTGQRSIHSSILGLNLTHWIAVNSPLSSLPQFTKWHAVKLPICLNHPPWLAVNSPLSSLP